MNFLTLYETQIDSVVFSRHPNYLSIEFVRMLQEDILQCVLQARAYLAYRQSELPWNGW